MDKKILIFREYTEYPTTDKNEVSFLESCNIKPSFTKDIDGAIVYKFKKTEELYLALAQFKRMK